MSSLYVSENYSYVSYVTYQDFHWTCHYNQIVCICFNQQGDKMWYFKPKADVFQAIKSLKSRMERNVDFQPICIIWNKFNMSEVCRQEQCQHLFWQLGCGVLFSVSWQYLLLISYMMFVGSLLLCVLLAGVPQLFTCHSTKEPLSARLITISYFFVLKSSKVNLFVKLCYVIYFLLSLLFFPLSFFFLLFFLFFLLKVLFLWSLIFLCHDQCFCRTSQEKNNLFRKRL